jgi:serine/threonine protein kinase
VALLSWERRLNMLHTVAAGMAHLHRRRVVHGDLRTANLFVCKDGHVKIGDFGFARVVQGARVGTEGFSCARARLPACAALHCLAAPWAWCAAM